MCDCLGVSASLRRVSNAMPSVKRDGALGGAQSMAMVGLTKKDACAVCCLGMLPPFFSSSSLKGIRIGGGLGFGGLRFGVLGLGFRVVLDSL